MVATVALYERGRPRAEEARSRGGKELRRQVSRRQGVEEAKSRGGKEPRRQGVEEASVEEDTPETISPGHLIHLKR